MTMSQNVLQHLGEGDFIMFDIIHNAIHVTQYLCPEVCNTDNPCDGIPCQNLGTCTKEVSGYSCSCFLGFDEKNDCEIGK